MRDDNIKVRMTMGIRSSLDARAPQSIGLTVTDEASHSMFLEIEITPDQLVRMLSGSELKADGWLLPEKYRDRIGKELVNEKIQLSKDMRNEMGYPGVTHIHELDHITSDSVRSWVKGTFDTGNWDDWTLSLHNDGWALHVRKWVAIETQEVVDGS